MAAAVADALPLLPLLDTEPGDRELDGSDI